VSNLKLMRKGFGILRKGIRDGFEGASMEAERLGGRTRRDNASRHLIDERLNPRKHG
jgi:hypothetical protein